MLDVSEVGTKRSTSSSRLFYVLKNRRWVLYKPIASCITNWVGSDVQVDILITDPSYIFPNSWYICCKQVSLLFLDATDSRFTTFVSFALTGKDIENKSTFRISPDQGDCYFDYHISFGAI
jgi:hypothetical protein